MSAIEECLSKNAAYAAEFAATGLVSSPAKQLALVACMDSRMDMWRLLGLRDGDAQVIRNAGGVVTEDVIRSLMISQRLLGTREIMLIHHTDCGALGFTDRELRDAVERDTGIRPPFETEAFSNLEDDVRKSIARIAASPFLPYKDAVRGFVYEVETGRLREVE